MTTKTFPTPAALREMREAAAAKEVDAAMDTITAALLKGDDSVPASWSEPARNVIVARLREAGWCATYTNNQRDGAWLKITAGGPGPMDDYYNATRQGR